MRKPLTMGSFPLESIQWTSPQEDLPTVHPDESKMVLDHTSIAGAEPVYNEVDVLFELHRKAPPWATFSPPDNFYIKRRQSHLFFHKNILPGVEPAPLLEKYEEELESMQTSNREFSVEASEKILESLELLESLNALLWFMQSRMLQYRKG